MIETTNDALDQLDLMCVQGLRMFKVYLAQELPTGGLMTEAAFITAANKAVWHGRFAEFARDW